MKTAKEILNDYIGIAIYYRDNGTLDNVQTKVVVRAMKEYAKLKCDEQREICANIVNGELPQNLAADECRIAPLPKFD